MRESQTQTYNSSFLSKQLQAKLEDQKFSDGKEKILGHIKAVSGHDSVEDYQKNGESEEDKIELKQYDGLQSPPAGEEPQVVVPMTTTSVQPVEVVQPVKPMKKPVSRDDLASAPIVALPVKPVVQGLDEAGVRLVVETMLNERLAATDRIVRDIIATEVEAKLKAVCAELTEKNREHIEFIIDSRLANLKVELRIV